MCGCCYKCALVLWYGVVCSEAISQPNEVVQSSFLVPHFFAAQRSFISFTEPWPRLHASKISLRRNNRVDAYLPQNDASAISR